MSLFAFFLSLGCHLPVFLGLELDHCCQLGERHRDLVCLSLELLFEFSCKLETFFVASNGEHLDLLQLFLPLSHDLSDFLALALLGLRAQDLQDIDLLLVKDVLKLASRIILLLLLDHLKVFHLVVQVLCESVSVLASDLVLKGMLGDLWLASQSGEVVSLALALLRALNRVCRKSVFSSLLFFLKCSHGV